ncbi:undecaprenyl-phosphate glucose phosphotransferase [uncultured Flavobacterium sp.]|uniref:undecaprenyl-phosphate glucose phosphotransferase n=1 Tax=uncultured Flavobacterium sp. TaxID=165435 RepID=UPI0030EDB955|tara:strand:+ start:44630 stop:45988 length:1359 start_codon:yes stop_codon:yes gene_type:complete
MNKGRYSKYIRPFSLFIDIITILLLFPFFFKGLNIDFILFGTFLFISWIVVSFFTKFYEVFRFTTPVEILSKIAKQAVFFTLVIIAFFPFYKKALFSGKAISLYILALFFIIIILKTLLFYYLKKYRLSTGNNYRNVVIVGFTEEAINLKNIFNERDDYGYRFKGFFSDKKKNEKIIGKTNLLPAFCIENKIDEIYCSLNEISNEQMKNLVEFSDENKIEIKFIPDSTDIFSKNFRTNYYELFPVLTLQKTPLHDPTIQLIKRAFDVVFSLLIVVGVLSWLTPLMALLIKLESKGPVFFKQSRPGINEEEFSCYKFRSMKINGLTETEASKNDPRVTKIGRFIRKTSVDEIPQFLNVLKGEMSVVGPRPHLWSQNVAYGNKVKKYMVRHYVKPGVTGLAQVKGFRGEIETDDDMINRIKFDVFYIENWSFIMDIKIIIQTVINIFKGEDKAY